MFAGAAAASADEIVLSNGDRFTGTLVGMVRGNLTFKTGYSSPVEIRLCAVRKLVTDRAVAVHLSGGEVLKGTIGSRPDGRITITPSDPRAAVTVDLPDIVAINPPRIRWEGGITLAGNLQTGNTDRTGASAVIEGVRRRAKDRISLSYLFTYGEEDRRVTTRNHFGVVKYDRFLVKGLYGYLNLDFLNDRFRDIKLTTTVGPGLGYQIWEDPRRELRVEAGIAYLFENYVTANNRDSWSARLAANIRYRFGTHLVFTDNVAFYPRVERGDRNRLRNEAVIGAPLTTRWTMRLSSILDYTSDPPDPVKKTDRSTTLGLQYVF